MYETTIQILHIDLTSFLDLNVYFLMYCIGFSRITNAIVRVAIVIWFGSFLGSMTDYVSMILLNVTVQKDVSMVKRE